MIFRSSDDEEYEYGDDINSIEVGSFFYQYYKINIVFAIPTFLFLIRVALICTQFHNSLPK